MLMTSKLGREIEENLPNSGEFQLLVGTSLREIDTGTCRRVYVVCDKQAVGFLLDEMCTKDVLTDL